jgi:hypothetical protein
MRQRRLTTRFRLVGPPLSVSEGSTFVSPLLEPDNLLKDKRDLKCSSSNTHAYFLSRNASLARNSLALFSSILGESIFKKDFVVKMIKRTHFLRHLALARLVDDMVEVQDSTELFARHNQAGLSTK